MDIGKFDLPDNMASFNYYLKHSVSNINYRYQISSGYTIVQEAVNPDGTPKIRSGYDRFYAIGNLTYFQHDSEHECSFDIKPNLLSKKESPRKVYFENVDNYHAKQFFKVITNHLRLINKGDEINKKKNPVYANLDHIEIYPVYVYHSLHGNIYQKIVLKFKKYKEFPELYIIVKNNEYSFENAVKMIDNEFFIRYYSQLIDKKDTTEKLTKSEKQIVKMYYY